MGIVEMPRVSVSSVCSSGEFKALEMSTPGLNYAPCKHRILWVDYSSYCIKRLLQLVNALFQVLNITETIILRG